MLKSQKDINPAKIFNNNINILFDKLSKEYPNYKPIKTYSSKFDDAKRMNYKMPAEMFLNIFAQHAQHINEKNEDHFFDVDFSQYTTNFTYINLIKEITQLWKDSQNDIFKNDMWASFKVLLYYSAKASGRDDIIDILKKKPVQ